MVVDKMAVDQPERFRKRFSCLQLFSQKNRPFDRGLGLFLEKEFNLFEYLSDMDTFVAG